MKFIEQMTKPQLIRYLRNLERAVTSMQAAGGYDPTNGAKQRPRRATAETHAGPYFEITYTCRIPTTIQADDPGTREHLEANPVLWINYLEETESRHVNPATALAPPPKAAAAPAPPKPPGKPRLLRCQNCQGLPEWKDHGKAGLSRLVHATALCPNRHVILPTKTDPEAGNAEIATEWNETCRFPKP